MVSSRHALDRLDGLGQVARPLLEEALQRRREDLFFLVRRREQLLAGFDPRAPQREHGRVAAVVEDHVAGLVLAPVEDARGIVPIILERFALDREHRNAARGDRRGGMVLGREDVAGRPAHFGAELDQRFDQHRGLDGHVQRAGDPRALQRLRRAEFLAQRHQARHLGLGDLDFLAAEIGKAEVLHDIVVETGFSLRRHVENLRIEWCAPLSAVRAALPAGPQRQI